MFVREIFLFAMNALRLLTIEWKNAGFRLKRRLQFVRFANFLFRLFIFIFCATLYKGLRAWDYFPPAIFAFSHAAVKSTRMSYVKSLIFVARFNWFFFLLRSCQKIARQFYRLMLRECWCARACG